MECFLFYYLLVLSKNVFIYVFRSPVCCVTPRECQQRPGLGAGNSIWVLGVGGRDPDTWVTPAAFPLAKSFWPRHYMKGRTGIPGDSFIAMRMSLHCSYFVIFFFLYLFLHCPFPSYLYNKIGSFLDVSSFSIHTFRN